LNFVQIRHTHGAPPWGSEHARRAKRNRRKRDHGRHWPSIDRVRLAAGGGAGGDGTGSLGCGGSEHTGGAGGHGAYVEAFKDYKDSEGWFGGGYVLHMSASTHVGYQQLVPASALPRRLCLPTPASRADVLNHRACCAGLSRRVGSLGWNLGYACSLPVP